MPAVSREGEPTNLAARLCGPWDATPRFVIFNIHTELQSRAVDRQVYPFINMVMA